MQIKGDSEIEGDETLLANLSDLSNAAVADAQGMDIIANDDRAAVWGEPDPVRREHILRSVWAEHATYTDPRADLAGLADLVAHIGRLLAGRPGAKIVRTSSVNSHHEWARFAWRVVQVDGTMLPEGLDLAEISGDGKIVRIVGFFGPLAPLD